MSRSIVRVQYPSPLSFPFVNLNCAHIARAAAVSAPSKFYVFKRPDLNSNILICEVKRLQHSMTFVVSPPTYRELVLICNQLYAEGSVAHCTYRYSFFLAPVQEPL